MPESAALAVERLRAGGLVAFPTETVWGLAASAVSPVGVERLFDWKGRSAQQPVSVLVSGPTLLEPLGFALSPGARALTHDFWPGPLTLILPCRHRFAPGVAAADGSVGVRCSSHADAAALVSRTEAAGVGPLTATSLNRSGMPPARVLEEAAALCGEGEAEPLLLETELDAGGELPSTVLNWTGRHPKVLRAGANAQELRKWLAERGFASEEES